MDATAGKEGVGGDVDYSHHDGTLEGKELAREAECRLFSYGGHMWRRIIRGQGVGQVHPLRAHPTGREVAAQSDGGRR